MVLYAHFAVPQSTFVHFGFFFAAQWVTACMPKTTDAQHHLSLDVMNKCFAQVYLVSEFSDYDGGLPPPPTLLGVYTSNECMVVHGNCDSTSVCHLIQCMRSRAHVWVFALI